MYLINYYSKKIIFKNESDAGKYNFFPSIKEFHEKQTIKNFAKKKIIQDVFNRKNPVIREHISYIISISFSRSNTFLTISKSDGSLCLSYNAGDLGLSGKQKKIRKSIVIKLMKLFISKYRFKYSKYSIGLHLLRTGDFRWLIVKYLRKYFFIKAIKGFDKSPYNGCRGRKPRRKKYISRLPLR